MSTRLTFLSAPFRKRQVVAITPNKENPTYVRIVVKGAPEYIMPLCTQVVSGPTEILKSSIRMTQKKSLNQQIIQPFASDLGLRTLAYAYKDMDK